MIRFYKIDCITNLHVGSGDINYNIIDNIPDPFCPFLYFETASLNLEFTHQYFFILYSSTIQIIYK